MQSLRTRRPTDAQSSARKSQRQSNRHAKPGPSSSSLVSRLSTRKSRVDDKIKKRISTRYADISSPTALIDGDSVPAVPEMPTSAAVADSVTDEVVRDRTVVQEDPREAEKRLLEDEAFDPDAYLKIKLANSTEAEIKSLQSSLRASMSEISSDLQRNVFKNYAEFVLISKEISTLENEMLELKESLAEWKGMPSTLHIDESASVADRRRNARSSIADLRVLYANQMQNLHAQIEGSAKFAPTTPGRHVVVEMDGMFELNAATYKIDHAVRFVVLDDAVLVAKRRRRNTVGGGVRQSGHMSAGAAFGSGGGFADAGGKLVAERCWPLSEMLVLDTKDSANMTNVFKVRHGKETHVYRAESSSDKKTLLSHFRHVAEELAARKRKEREGEHERRKSLWAAGDRSSYPMSTERVQPIPDWMADLTARAGGDSTEAKEKMERDTLWVGEWSDELTVAIALREWDKAVSLVEQGKAKLFTTPQLSAKLPVLTTSLITALLQSLSSPTNRKSTSVKLISLLLRLQAGAVARNTFLNARSDAMRKHIRAIRFEGSIGVYVGDLAMVVFTSIKHTADWFLASFKENEVASSFVEWARIQVVNYAEMFRKQVYTSDVDPKVVEEALRITYSQSRKLLQEYGLDFRFLLDELLVEKPKETMKSLPTFSFRDHRASTQTTVDSPTSPLITPNRLVSPVAGMTSRFRSPGLGPTSPSSSLAPLAFIPPTASASASGLFPNRGQSHASISPLSPPAPPPVPVLAPTPRRSRSPPPNGIALRVSMGTTSSRASGRSIVRASNGSPAPPPRSTNRPGSAISHRPPPVAVPRRDDDI